jgi:predicted dienelactone hydrolase
MACPILHPVDDFLTLQYQVDRPGHAIHGGWHQVRPLEIAATLSVVAYLLSLLSSSRGENPWFAALPLLSVALLGWHAIGEGARWQLLPIYLVAGLVLAGAAVGWVTPIGWPYPVAAAGLLVVVSGIAFGTALPVFELPAPTGPYRTGTQVRHIVDLKRRDPVATDETIPRELMIQIWYPVDAAATGARSPYRERNATTVWDARYALARTHSLVQAAMSGREAAWPVVLFAPSWWGERTEATVQAEELASHGYVVVGIDHPYASRLTVFPDGRVVRTRLVVAEDYESDASFQTFIAAADEQVRVRAEDARSVLDALERFNADDPDGQLSGRLDLAHVGMLGFSLGGGVAAQACWLDRRFRAGVDLDGMIAAEAAQHGTRAPFLFIFGNDPPMRHVPIASDDAATRREATFRERQFEQMRRSLMQNGGYVMTLPGLRHADFSDNPFTSPLHTRALLGMAGAEPNARIVSRYVLAFFDAQFGKDTHLLEQGPPGEIAGATLQAFK